jgi:hypothetical protein
MKAGYGIGYRRVGMEFPMHSVINFLCIPLAHSFSSPTLWTKCRILLTEMSSLSPGFIKWWARCLNLNVTKASQSQTTCVDVSDGCLHLSHLEWFTNLGLNGCPLKWQCPLSKPVNLLSWFLLRLNNSPVFCTGFLKKAFSTHTIWILLRSGSFMRDWWPSQNNLEFIWKLSRALMTAWLLERI